MSIMNVADEQPKQPGEAPEQSHTVTSLQALASGRSDRAINRAKAAVDHLETMREKLRQAQRLLREIEEGL